MFVATADRFIDTDPITRAMFDRGKRPPEELRSPAEIGEGITWLAPDRRGNLRANLREGTVVAYRRWAEGNRIGALLMECRDAEDSDKRWMCPVSSPDWQHASRPLPEADLEGVVAMLATRGDGYVNLDDVRHEFGL